MTKKVEWIKEVLKAYTVYPLAIEQKTQNLFWVNDGKQEYALKRSSLNEQTIKQWKRVFEQAHMHNMTTVLPVYLTKDGSLYKEMDQFVFYLTPWIIAHNDEGTRQTIDHFYNNIGSIHAKTKHSQLIQMDKLKENFSTYQLFCKNTKEQLLDYVKHFEKSRYMSPLELQVCTQYRDLEFALHTIDKRIEQFLTEDEEEQLTWNDCLTHGNLSFSHVLNPYIINWEQATHENAVLDLSIFFQHEIAYYDSPIDLFIELFPTYNNVNELTLREHYLLIIYLLNPTQYISRVQEYRSNPSHQTMISQIITLQHVYRKLLFGLKWSDYVEKEYESVSFEDLES